MLTSFFSKSNPIHFVIIAGYMAIFYVVANFFLLEKDLTWAVITTKTLGLVAFLLTMMILNFIAKKNELTGRNTYRVILFAAFCTVFLKGLQNTDLIFANLFVVMGLRRVIGLKSQIFAAEKIFDAVFWICIASLFSFWAIGFLLVVYFGILFHVSQNYKNWLIPVMAFFAAYIIATCFFLWTTNEFYDFKTWFQPTEWDFSFYRNLQVLIPLSIILAVSLWTILQFFAAIQKASAGVRPSLILVLLYFAVAIAVSILSPTKDTSEFMFFLVPLSIIVANFFDVASDKWFKEILFILLLLLPFVLPLF